MNKQNKGITLIALVITIVVLVILVGVSVSVAINTGLIGNSKTAVADYDNAQKEEEQVIQNVVDIVKEYSGIKKVSNLYDGYNDPADTENYNENGMHIGDYVKYTAGTWSETVAHPAFEAPFTFGGYTVGQSREKNANGGLSSIGKVYEGWRVWDISGDTITLISAGCPEVYRHNYGSNYAYNTEMVLIGETNGIPADDKPSTPREWNADYVNRAQYASSARVLTKEDLDYWYNKYIDNTITDSYEPESFPENKDNKLISTVVNNATFWIATAQDSDSVYFVDSDGWIDYDDLSRVARCKNSCYSII